MHKDSGNIWYGIIYQKLVGYRKWNIIPKAGRIWEMEHNVRYGKIWLEIFGIGIKWKMRGVASLLWIYQFRHAPARQFI